MPDPTGASRASAVAVPTGNTYDKYATTNPIERRLMRGFLAALDHALPEAAPLRVLEVGLGEGEVARRLARRWPAADITGLDLPDAELAAHWQGGPFAALFGDVGHLPFADATFDLVLAVEVLEHVPDPPLALSELARVARRDLVLTVPREPVWRVANLARGKYIPALGNTPGHVNHWSKAAFAELVGRHVDVHTVRSPFPWTVVGARAR
ncbi:MAG: Methyltransferase type 11 [Acidimicrobiales bacterium]|nr:Methyltransferase type 11 [Acidimicrobiales bacterium]